MSNKEQYSLNGIFKYEWIFGDGFLGYGEPDTTKNLIEQMSWKPGTRVLDVGSGLGGPAFLMSSKYKAVVTGVDLTKETVQIAKDRQKASGFKNVEFFQGDIHQMEWEEGAFDIIWSRETLLHVPNKDELFQKFHSWLAPGGALMITDYSKSKGRGSDKFENYVKESGYPLIESTTYADHIKQAGFKDVNVKDQSDFLIQLLKENLKKFEDKKQEFIDRFSEEDYTSFKARWELKLDCSLSKDMKWCWFSAVK
jgi:phosphoethanolamine N-methyltransferase